MVMAAHCTGKSTVLLRLAKPSVTGLLWGNPPVTDQRWSLRKNTSNGESASLSWRHHHTGNNYLIPYDDVIKWKHFPRYWPFVRGIHRSPVNSPHKGKWHGALMFTLIWARINGWVNNFEAGDLRRNLAHYYVIVIFCWYHFNGLVQDWCISSSLAMEVLQSCTKPSI